MKGKGRILSHYSVSFFLSTFAQCLSCTELFKMTLIKKNAIMSPAASLFLFS